MGLKLNHVSEKGTVVAREHHKGRGFYEQKLA